MSRVSVVALLAVASIFSVSSTASADPAKPAATRSESVAASPRVRVGILVAADLATASVVPSPGTIASRRFLGGGGALDVRLGGPLSFDSRVVFSRKGARLVLDRADRFQEVTADYLAAPLLLKVRGRGAMKPYAVSGLEVAFRLSARSLQKDGQNQLAAGITEHVRPVDLSLAIGGGVERQSTRFALFAETLYAHGLRNVFRDSWDVEAARTRTVTFSAGIRF
jgi:hypothetical protein